MNGRAIALFIARIINRFLHSCAEALRRIPSHNLAPLMIQSPLPGSSLGPINRSHSAGSSDLNLECEGEAEEFPMVAKQDY
jgi:hypothetical protein